jgi:hypothetical protein
MFEKYNAFEMGSGGGGGEYTPQIGFGWSNGVALVMLNSSSFSQSSSDDHDEGLSSLGIALISIGVVMASLLIAGGIYFFILRQSRPPKGLLASEVQN